MATHLEPCPFCKGRAEMAATKAFGHEFYLVRCVSCGSQSSTAGTAKAASQRWNRRDERKRQ